MPVTPGSVSHAWGQFNKVGVLHTPNDQIDRYARSVSVSRINAATRSAWLQALARPPASDSVDADQALLRLEMAADLPTPAEHLDARRALQLQLLTRRNDPPPAQTWAQDAARVLACPHAEAQARRLRNALKLLLR